MAIKRRQFLSSAAAMAALGTASRYLPMAGGSLLGSSALAAPNFEDLGVSFNNTLTTDSIPRFINIFLYGGPSELAGNLTNIVDINANSQNPYGGTFDPQNANTIVTPNYFWSTAGGDIMEELIASGDMTIYRTMNRVKDQNKAHGICVQQNLVGNLDVYTPGMATTLAWIIEQNNPFRNPDNSVKDLSQVVFPFVTFEGESKAFNRGEIEVLPTLKPIALNANLLNPYQRRNASQAFLTNGSPIDLALESMSKQVNAAGPYGLTAQSMEQRAVAADNISTMLSGVTVDSETYGYGTGNFGQRLSAAVSLAIANPETLYISLGSGGLGGWDDHSEMIRRYPGRMNELMIAVGAAVKHLNAASLAGVSHADKIVINIFGEFGRNVNLNESLGWDHGNNQNLYTFGGKGLAGRGRNLGQ
ncbi:MAG: DUF1501 domain-containing protein, partial [Gammaproteobacteria bacterium]|nr:DUF1501 domain-containing protein [Gammaproteobacteria bacterium]